MGSPNSASKQVLVVGCGRAGSSLALTLARRGWSVSVTDRLPARARALARRFHFSNARTRRWDLLVLAVPDPSIAAAAREWSRAGLPPALAVHLGGAVPAEALAPLARAGWRTAKVHPVFAFPAEPAPLPRGVAFGVGAPTPAGLREAGVLARRLGGRPVPIRPGGDRAWHLASVVAGNFLHAQLSAASTLLESAAALEPGTALEVMAPLVRSSLHNAREAGLGGGLTGPVARGDARAVEAHLLTLMDQHPELSVFYASSTALLTRLLPPGRRAALRRRLKRAGILI